MAGNNRVPLKVIFHFPITVENETVTYAAFRSVAKEEKKMTQIDKTFHSGSARFSFPNSRTICRPDSLAKFAIIRSSLIAIWLLQLTCRSRLSSRTAFVARLAPKKKRSATFKSGSEQVCDQAR